LLAGSTCKIESSQLGAILRQSVKDAERSLQHMHTIDTRLGCWAWFHNMKLHPGYRSSHIPDLNPKDSSLFLVGRE
jgi:hypothetical protein